MDGTGETRDLVELARTIDTVEAFCAWERRCNECVEILRDTCRIKYLKTCTGILQSLTARISLLENARKLLRDRFTYIGGGGGSDHGDRRGFLWSMIETAFESRVLTGAIINLTYVEPRRFLEDVRDEILVRVRENLKRHACLKVDTVFNGEFVSGVKVAVKSIATRNHPLFGMSDLREWYDVNVIDSILTDLEEFQERDSGWALSRILNLMLNINKHNPMHAGCWIETPSEIKWKRAVVNVRSTDNACFAWSVVAALYPIAKNVNRCTEYPHYINKLNLNGIEFPMTLKQISRFERLNDISINVFTIRDKDGGSGKNSTKIVPLKVTGDKKDRHVNLLYLESTSRDNNVGHFVWIKNLSRLLSSQMNKLSHMKHVCDRCLHYFPTRERLSAHGADCARMNNTAIVLPKDNDKWLYFYNYERKERLPFVVYADLECVLEKEEERMDKDPSTNSYAYQHHRAFSVGYYVCSAYDTIPSVYKFNRGEKCISWFVNELNALAHRVSTVLSVDAPPVELTDHEKLSFSSATYCYVCDGPFDSIESRVRDHCHVTGRYKGAAHPRCNFNYRKLYVVPIFFHNLSGYDAHFIIESIANAFDGTVDLLLPITKERYISFTKNVKGTSGIEDRWKNCVKLRFVDSYKFLDTSLEKLVSYLDRSKLKITRSQFAEIGANDFKLLTRKGVFPYEYVSNVEKLRETQLPSREAFRSSLTGETVSESDYEHASKVWRRFGTRDLGDYNDLYLKKDVLLLADVFENFRDSCIHSYELDPAHYYTLPGFAWDAMLKHTGIYFELLTDIDMVMFVERGVRGGLSQCSNRYARANNKYMSSYDSSRPSTYLMYFDVNNLYGWAMCESLPYANFRWVENAESFDVTSVSPDSDVGYILEVDLAYPRELHDAHADLPFCPTREKPPGKRFDKLLATLCDKNRYVIHYRNLQQCLRHGLRLTRIHRVLRFAQSPWLRGYIELNTTFRARADNEFEKNIYKLMNNSVFGKTMENVREHVDVRLVTCWEGRRGAEVFMAKPNFHSRSVFSENLMAIELRKLEIKLNKPIYLGMCILEISKTRLYDFHYGHMAPLYRDRCKIMYTDTDSLIYLLHCEDAYSDMKRNIAQFDTSDFSENNKYGMPRVNETVPGLMKDKNNGAIMTEFVGLRAKMYALRVTGKNDTKKIKGISSSAVAREITFDDYTRCLNEAKERVTRQSCIRSRLHEMLTVSKRKLALSPYDDKRYVTLDSYETLPWGHYNAPLQLDVLE